MYVIACFVFGTLVGCFYAHSRYYKGKWKTLKQSYDKRCKELTDALGEVGRVKIDNESIREANNAISEKIRDYKHLLTADCRNMKVLERTLPMLPNIPQGAVVVAGVDTRRSDLCFPIKTFLYDPNDPGDHEFAIREAEELIEIIQNF